MIEPELTRALLVLPVVQRRRAWRRCDEKLETKPWGLRQLSVLDPAGNRLTFAERVTS